MTHVVCAICKLLGPELPGLRPSPWRLRELQDMRVRNAEQRGEPPEVASPLCDIFLGEGAPSPPPGWRWARGAGEPGPDLPADAAPVVVYTCGEDCTGRLRSKVFKANHQHWLKEERRPKRYARGGVLDKARRKLRGS